MSATSTPSKFNTEDADHGWKPNNRPHSTVARNFMSELDDLFRLDGGIDVLDKNVHQKKQAVSHHAQELEALEAKLRETEERLKQAKTSPPRRKDSQRRTPIQSAFPDEDRARLAAAGSPLAARRKENARPQKDLPDRPRTAQTEDGEKA
ncbi:hypothetical protein BU26DRAFT_513621 [Trematosphaeria pertusa]|uniref:Uncharacterized protein n=1 Tax=Trematosphaeria pertusa TaxID=390896 RepID=A0A6A6J5V5_9PLEO|nr:uncharacterized protein BU26DRAFT_513621 [Trematosphaeria pertusa]KAF2256863.1 hypothetical protein BU26DRAFT_513621 [Trematosphaeria pertusa]